MYYNFYKAHLHEIDLMLPYYLKGLEILVQHYTVPVALGKSIDDAPDVFKPGLKKMIEKLMQVMHLLILIWNLQILIRLEIQCE